MRGVGASEHSWFLALTPFGRRHYHMTAEEIITKFEEYVSDITELSTQEELDLVNKIYLEICSERPWEFLKKNAAGTILQDTTGYYISVPSDFGFFTENNTYTDNSYPIPNNASPKVIFVGASYDPYQIVNYSDRIQYRTQAGKAYLDMAGGKIRFTGSPSPSVMTTYNFDYCYIPAELTLDDSPIFPARFHGAIYHKMATESTIIDISDRAHSYAPENQKGYEDSMSRMEYWNSQLILD